jgi:hypothetical protein
MRAGRLLAVLAVAALGVGLFSATALAGKKKKTAVVFFSGSPKFSASKTNKSVNAKGTLNTVAACKVSRSMKLFVTDASGVVLASLDGSTTDSSGNWKLQGQIPSGLPAGSAIQVKATKRTAGKFVCKAGFSALVPIPAT